MQTQLEDFKIPIGMNTSKIVQNFQNTLQDVVRSTFPEKRILIDSDDKPYFSEKLRHLKRIRQREYHKHGRSQKYLKLKENFEEKLSQEKSDQKGGFA